MSKEDGMVTFFELKKVERPAEGQTITRYKTPEIMHEVLYANSYHSGSINRECKHIPIKRGYNWGQKDQMFSYAIDDDDLTMLLDLEYADTKRNNDYLTRENAKYALDSRVIASKRTEEHETIIQYEFAFERITTAGFWTRLGYLFRGVE